MTAGDNQSIHLFLAGLLSQAAAPPSWSGRSPESQGWEMLLFGNCFIWKCFSLEIIVWKCFCLKIVLFGNVCLEMFMFGNVCLEIVCLEMFLLGNTFVWKLFYLEMFCLEIIVWNHCMGS